MNDQPIRVVAPISRDVIAKLSAGDQILLSGVIYTARDAAHARLVELIRAGKPLPIDLTGQIIYYAGPSPAKPGQVIGSIGPTTSGRMDAYTPELLAAGLKGMIGKGLRSQNVIDSIVGHKAIYFAATGGAAALLAKRIVSCEVIAYEDLGCEAIHKLEVREFPLIVINDSSGRDFYRENQSRYSK